VSTPDGRVHLSRTVQTESPLTGLTMMVRLTQRSIDDRPRLGLPVIDLLIRYPDYGPEHPGKDYSICVDSDLAQAAGRMLLDAGREASR